MKKNALIAMLSIVAFVATLFGGVTLTASAAENAHGWSDRTGPGDPVDIRTTNEETGFSEIQMVYAHGAYNVNAISVARPFKIAFSNDEVGTNWGPAFMLTDGLTNATNFSGAGSMPVIGRNQNPTAPSAWEGAKIQFCMPWQEDEPLLYLLNTASAGFYDGVSGAYSAEAANTAMGQNGEVAAHASSQYEFYFDIQDTQGDANGGTGSKLIVTENKADGTSLTATFYLTVTRSNFSKNNAYFAFASVAHKNYSFFKIARERTLIKSVADNYNIEELYIDGEQVSAEDIENNNTFNAYYGDLIKLRVSGSDAMVKAGDLVLAPEPDGYCYFYMSDATTTLSVQEANAAYYTVSYETDGGTVYYSRGVRAGAAAVRPAVDPIKTDCTFGGWFADENKTVAFDFEKAIAGDTVVYAKWVQKYAVTYVLAGFSDYVTMVSEGANAPQAELRNFHAHGGTGNKDNFTNVDSLEIFWYSDEARTKAYDFSSGVSGETVLYGKLTEVKQYTEPTASGWDTLGVTKDAHNTIFMDTMFTKSPFDTMEDGSAIYNISKSADYGVYSRALDVSKPIEISATFESVAENGWFSFSLFDKLTLAQMSEANGINPKNSGSLVSFAFNSKTGGLLTNGVRDVPVESYGENVDGYVYIPGFAEGKALHIKIVIGAEAGSSYIELDGEKAFELSVTRGDFQDGKAYLAVAGFVTQQVELNVIQSAAFTDASENGTAAVRQVGSLFVAKIAAADGYKFDGNITVDGEKVAYEKADECDILDLEEDEVLLFMPSYHDGAVTVGFTKGEEGGESGGCGGYMGVSAGIFGASALVLATAALIVRRKQRDGKQN